LSPESPAFFEKLRISVAPTVHSVLNYTVRVDLLGTAKKSFSISGDGQITEAIKKLTQNSTVHFHEVYSFKPFQNGRLSLELSKCTSATFHVG